MLPFSTPIPRVAQASCLCGVSAVSLIMGCAPIQPAIVLDGVFDDWQDIPKILDDAGDAEGQFVDFGQVAVTHDERFVHLLVDFGNELNPQGLKGRAKLLLDVDGNPSTGKTMHNLPGVDVYIVMTPPNPWNEDKPGFGVALHSVTYPTNTDDSSQEPLTVYDAGFTFAPTYANTIFEFRLERGRELPLTPLLFTGKRFSGKLIYQEEGEIIDETEAFTFSLDGGAKRSLIPAQPTDPIAKSDKVIRVVSWNGQRGALLLNPKPFIRTLKALDPDVLLLQELTDKTSAYELKSFLNRALHEEGEPFWHVEYGEGGGDLRSVVASRIPLSDAPTLKLLPFPERDDWYVRTAGAYLDWQGRRIAVMSVHLKCCGRKDSREDEVRITETTVINDALKSLQNDPEISGIIVAGDMNLVGGRDPLDNLVHAIDLDGSDLAISQPIQLDGLSNATWRDPGEPFAAGRLDYVMFSDSTLTCPRMFVFDSRDLTEHWLQYHSIETDDIPSASDHFPVVVDLHWCD